MTLMSTPEIDSAALPSHAVTETQSGAVCSCGRTFSIYDMRTYSADRAAARLTNLAKSNARRHAASANRKAAEVTA